MTEPTSEGKSSADSKADSPADKPKPPADKADAKKAAAADAKKAAAKKAPEKKAAKKPVKKKAKKPKEDPKITRRRGLVQLGTTGFIAGALGATVKFFFPRVLFEPSTRFGIGFPSDYAFGVSTKFQQAKRIWVVKQPGKMFVIFARCTHLGCTPDWKPAENKFKCPCHGSGFDMEGVNFEGPAPQPLLRTSIDLDARGEIIVDKGKLFPAPDWADPASYLVV